MGLWHHSPRQKPSRGRRGGGGGSDDDLPGVEISIAGALGEMVRALMDKSTATFYTLLESATTDDLDKATLILTDLIHQSLSLHVPLSKPCSRSKRWWTEELSTMRQAMAKQFRKWKSTQLDSEYADYKRHRNTYFRAIGESKADRW